MDFAILKISDGTTTVDLLNISGSGFVLNNWTPNIAQPKGGGVFQSSTLATNRRLIDRVFDNVSDTYDLKITGDDQNAIILNSQNLIRLLEKATEYWTTDWQNTPVYLIAKAKCETNTRYALVVNYIWDSLANPYAQPFYSSTELLDNIVISIERQHWLSQVPGQSECTQINNITEWLYNNEFSVVDSTPSGQVWDTYETSDGRVWALDWGLPALRVSSDNGDSWATNTGAIAQPSEMIELANGYYIVCSGATSTGGIWRSVNGGVAWVEVVTNAGTDIERARSAIQTNTGRIIVPAGTDTSGTNRGTIFYSDNNGDSWSSSVIMPTSTRPDSIAQSALTNTLIMTDESGGFWRSVDDGDNWTFIQKQASAGSGSSWVLYMSNGNFIAGTMALSGDNNIRIYLSTDDGLSWELIVLIDAGAVNWSVHRIIELSTPGHLMLSTNDGSANGAIYFSNNYGFTWYSFDSSDEFYGLHQASNDFIFAGADGDTYRNKYETLTVGRDNTCNNEAYITNKSNQANLTHIKVDDGGAFTDILPIPSFPQALLPATPATNDAIYFGSATAVFNSGTFDSLVFDIDTPASSTTSYTLLLEYYNGGWVTLSSQDNTDTGTSALSAIGVNSIHWDIPSDWTTTTIDGVAAYWVRLRLSALTGTLTPPTQQNRDIYSLNSPFVQIDDTSILGDITALMQEKAFNQSSNDSRSGSLWSNRLITGLRLTSRGDDFNAYLNCSDEQQATSVNVTAGTNTSFADDITTPTTRRMTYNPAGVEAMATRATISLGSPIIPEYYGTFHVFLRGRRTAGSASDIDVQIQFVTGSGGLEFTTESKQFQTTTAWEMLDFGQVKLPVSVNLMGTDLGDTTEIRIQASAASGTPDLYLYDLILIPTDEWAIDSVDFTNNSNSVLGQVDNTKRLLIVDSLTNFKLGISSLLRTIANLIVSTYDSITNGEAQLQANVTQRLWYLSAHTSATGSDYSWISEPEVSHSVQLFKNERYLGFRGDR